MPQTLMPRPPLVTLRPLHLVLLSTLSLGACTTVHVDVPPASIQAPAHFEHQDNALTKGVHLAQWWRAIADPTLSALIEQGLKGNADIRMAITRVSEARAVVSQAESALYPTLQGFGYTAHTDARQIDLSVPNVSVPGLPPLSSVSALSPLANPPASHGNGLGLSAAWEVDVFGSRRSDAEAARGAALAHEERLHGVQLVVAGDIAANYVEARSLERRLDVLQRSVSQTERLRRYVQGRFEAGQATRYDIDRVQAQLQALQGARAPLQNLLQSRLRRIAVLTGQLPSQWPHLPAPDALAPADGSVIPSQLPDLLPSDVLERRPDVRGAAQIVPAQAARLGSAKADLLPRFYLGFLANDGRIEIGDLATSGRLVSWGAGLRLPIFEGGRLRARIQASDAQLQAAVTQYEQAVLGALEDVENAYSTRRALDQRSQQVRAALSTAQVGARHAQRLFEEGNGLLQGAVEAQQIALQREDELIQAETARALVTVALYKAVGGGWPQPH